MLEDSAPLEGWAPGAFVTHCALGGRSTTLRLVGEGPLLLVLLDERNGELESGLAATSPLISSSEGAGSSPPGSNLAFKTELRDPRSVLATIANRRRMMSLRPTPADGLPTDLLFRSCFVVPLRKRKGSTSLFAERITVGRARNHDIVLRHGSVSKFHAWFEHAEGGTMKVADAGSRNHTFVDGAAIKETPIPLRTGAVVKFGSVESVFTTFDALWSLISQAQS